MVFSNSFWGENGVLREDVFGDWVEKWVILEMVGGVVSFGFFGIL